MYLSDLVFAIDHLSKQGCLLRWLLAADPVLQFSQADLAILIAVGVDHPGGFFQDSEGAAVFPGDVIEVEVNVVDGPEVTAADEVRGDGVAAGVELADNHLQLAVRAGVDLAEDNLEEFISIDFVSEIDVLLDGIADHDDDALIDFFFDFKVFVI